MKKTLGLILSAVMLAALLAGMRMTVFAADEVSSHIADETGGVSAAPGATGADAASLPDDAARLNDVNGASALNDINPISANPETGSESLAIPAAIALLAASTAAIALSAKKKEEK